MSYELLREQNLQCRPVPVALSKFEHLIYYKSNVKPINCKVEDYVHCLENQIDGLTGVHDTYSYYTFNGQGMKIFLKHLKEDAKLSNESTFLDVGSGRGHTVFCVANILKPAMSYGIEGDDIRVMVFICCLYYY
jgi:hypothetical protein